MFVNFENIILVFLKVGFENHNHPKHVNYNQFYCCLSRFSIILLADNDRAIPEVFYFYLKYLIVEFYLCKTRAWWQLDPIVFSYYNFVSLAYYYVVLDS